MAMHINNSCTLPYFSHYELASDRVFYVWIQYYYCVVIFQIRTAVADIVISLAVGAFWALAFEYPGINLEQVLFSATSWKREKTLQDEKALLTESESLEDCGMKNLKVQ